MNEQAPQQNAEFVFRRFSESIPFVPTAYNSSVWLVLTGLVTLLAILVVLYLYSRDRRTIGWRYAAPLACLRSLVFFLLAFAFLLPAIQYWQQTEKQSRVLVIFDISPSITQTSDVISSSGTQPKTRMDQVLDLITDENVKLLSTILNKNPIYCYRFGNRLDEESQHLTDASQMRSREEWDKWLHYDFKPLLLNKLSTTSATALTRSSAWKGDEAGTVEWVTNWLQLPETEAVPAELLDIDREILKSNRETVEKRLDIVRSIRQGTNVPESLTALLNREAGNMVQGVVVISDGRSNLGSQAEYQEFRELASREKVPVFMILVGEFREQVAISITDLQAPDRAPPDEQFKIVVEADGVGLADQEVPVYLDIFSAGNDPQNGKPDHVLTQSLKFRGDSTPPHGSIEFQLDPESPDIPPNLTEPSKKAGRSRQFLQGPWQFVARIGRDKREVFQEAFHASMPQTVQILDKPLRVLLFAGGATRDYQTLRTLLVRETQQKRAELSIYLQTDAVREGTAVQDVPAERLLTRFPTHLDTSSKTAAKPEERYYNLNEYDLIIAFDPDWSELSAEQVRSIQEWVDNLGGGFIFVAGPIHTYQLARADESGRLKPLLDILPVVPDDIILVKTRPVPRSPRMLNLRPNPEFDVLQLDDSIEDNPTAGWDRYFHGENMPEPRTKSQSANPPTRGFYSYYPVKQTKPGSSTLAEFLELPDSSEASFKIEPQPWLVTAQPARGRSIFIGSGEVWRLRTYDQDFYDRFWIKMCRFASSNRDSKTVRGRVLISKEYRSNSMVRVQVRLLAPNARPYPVTEINPKFTVVRYSASGDRVENVKEEGPYELKPRLSANSEFDGYYTGQLVADERRFPPGDHRYRVVVDVPDSAGDTIHGEFVVRVSDPELDNTRPDLQAAERLASKLVEIEARIKDPNILNRLRGNADPSQISMVFRLAERDKIQLIPEFFDKASQVFRNRGPVRDLWDRGPTLRIGSRDMEVSWLLLAATGLLSLEWLTRKLLRLA